MRTPTEGRPIPYEVGQSLVVGKVRFFSGSREYPIWANSPPIWPWQPDMRMKFQLVRVEPREVSFVAPLREGGTFYWFLSPGQYLLAGYLYRPNDDADLGAGWLGTCLPEGASYGASVAANTLAVFVVPEAQEAVYLGTLNVEVAATVGLQWIWQGDAETAACVRSLHVIDELDAQVEDLQRIYPGTRISPATQLMTTGVMLPSAQDENLKRKVDDILRGPLPQ